MCIRDRNTADVTVMSESGNQSLTESAVMDEARLGKIIKLMKREIGFVR